MPHTHPEDENITVLTGIWALGMGSRVNVAELEPMEQGALGFVPKKMAHFGYAKVETMLQVHGIGPFVNLPIDPVFELTSKGVLVKPSLLKPGVPTASSPPNCFKLPIGTRMRGDRGEGVVVRWAMFAGKSVHAVLDQEGGRREILVNPQRFEAPALIRQLSIGEPA